MIVTRFGAVRFVNRHFTVYGFMLNKPNLSQAIVHIIIRKTLKWLKQQPIYRFLKCDPFISNPNTLCFCFTRKLKKLQAALKNETTLAGFTIEIDFGENAILLSFMV